jgi:hypothetical protein
MNALWAEETGNASDPMIVVIHGSMVAHRDAGSVSDSTPTSGAALRPPPRPIVPRRSTRWICRSVTSLVCSQVVGRCSSTTYGGDVALAAAEQHPDLVAGVAVYETPLSWEPWWPGTTAGAIAVAAAGKPQEAADRFMRRMLGDQRWEDLPERTREARLVEGVAMVEELADLRSHRPWIAENITVPVITATAMKRAASSGMNAPRAFGCPCC